MASNDYILSLSWQVLDNNLNTLEEHTRYFKNPLPEPAIKGALKVNCLTNAELEKRGTSNKKAGLEEFTKAAQECDMLVGHNIMFDVVIINNECKRENESFATSALLFDTMKDMTDYCIYYAPHRYHNWPKLIKLASMLGVDTSDINWHQSSADVEATARCLRVITSNGFAPPQTVPKKLQHKQHYRLISQQNENLFRSLMDFYSSSLWF